MKTCKTCKKPLTGKYQIVYCSRKCIPHDPNVGTEALRKWRSIPKNMKILKKRIKDAHEEWKTNNPEEYQKGMEKMHNSPNYYNNFGKWNKEHPEILKERGKNLLKWRETHFSEWYESHKEWGL